MSAAFLAIGIVIALAALLGAWASFFRLPLILAYIVAGIIVGPFILNSASGDTFNLLRDLGLSLLLFLVGLEIKTDELKQFGKESLVASAVQIVGTLILGLIFSLVLGFALLPSFYIALAVTFSSTVIVVKLLDEKRDYNSLYGKISVSILLIQDLVAISFLIFLSSFKVAGKLNITTFVVTIFLGIVAFVVIYYLNRKVLPYLFERLARNIELLFLSSLAWLFLISAFFSFLGFSIEIGAFIAGLGLASLKEENQIASRVRPLRDFFLVIFFIVLGSHIVLNFNFDIVSKAVLLSLFVLIVKPLVILLTLGRQGFRRRTAFMSGVSLSQISEFSLVIIFLGLNSGHVNNQVVSIITLATIITIAVSTYNLVYARKIYRRVEKHLRIFEIKEQIEEPILEKDLVDHTILIGAGRLGWEILKQLEKQGEKLLVVDFNPTVINYLKEKGIDYLFGDITDPDIASVACLDKARLVISTVYDPDDATALLEQVSSLTHKPTVFVTAADRETALKYYKMGASYVIIPRILSGHQVAHLLSRQKLEEIMQGEVKKDHIAELQDEMTKLAL